MYTSGKAGSPVVTFSETLTVLKLPRYFLVPITFLFYFNTGATVAWAGDLADYLTSTVPRGVEYLALRDESAAPDLLSLHVIGKHLLVTMQYERST